MMNILRCLSLVFISSIVSFYTIAQGSWKPLSDLSTSERENAVSFGLNQRIYIGTGATDNGYQSDFWEFDPVVGTWSQKADLPGVAREMAIGFTAINKGFIGLGLSDGGELDDLWSYDPISNVWTEKKSFEAGQRYAATCAVENNIAYVGLGRDGSGSLTSDFWSYDPIADDWIQLTAYTGGAREFATSFAIDGKVYVGLGNTTLTNVKKDLYEYNITGNSWTQKTDLTGVARSSAVGYTSGASGVVGLGNDTNIDVLKDFWLYDPQGNSWSALSDMEGAGRFGATVAVLDDIAYVGTGSSGGSRFKDFWKFDASHTTSPPILSKVAIVASNKVLIEWEASADGYIIERSIGNETSYEVISTISSSEESFLDSDVATNSDLFYRVIAVDEYGNSEPSNSLRAESEGSWTELGLFAEGPRSAPVSFAYNDFGYVGGASFLITDDFWKYDPDQDTWTQLADMGDAARSEPASFVLGENLYVLCGQDQNQNLLKSVMKYNFSSNSWVKMKDFGGVARYAATAFVVNNTAYFGFGEGENYSYLKDFWKYNDATDDWTQLSDFDGKARRNAFAFTIQDKVYLGGSSRSEYKDFWIFDSSLETWSQIGDVPFASVYDLPTFVIDEKAYVVSNELGSEFTERKTHLWQFDPQNNTWRRKANFPGKERSGAVDFAIKNTIYFGFGSPSGVIDDFWKYELNAEGVAAPRNLRIDKFSDSEITISWDDVSDNESSFVVELSTDFKSFHEQVRTEANVTSFSHSEIVSNSTYVWRVKAVNETAESDYTEIVYDNTGPNWARRANFPNESSTGSPVFSTDDKAYFLDSSDNDQKSRNLWEYDPIADVWTQKSNFYGTPRHNATTFAVQGKGYIVGGDVGFIDYVKDVWQYDPNTNYWEQKGDFPDQARVGSTGFGSDSKGYMVFGETTINGDNNLKELWEYDPAQDLWTRKSDFPEAARRGGNAFVLGSKIFAGLGDTGLNSNENNFYEYDVAMDNWTKRQNSPVTYGAGSAFVIQNQIYMRNSNSNNNTIYRYDIDTDNWVGFANYPGIPESSGFVAFGIKNRGYIGILNSNDNELWEFIPIPYAPFIISASAIPTASVELTLSAVDSVNIAGLIIQRAESALAYENIDTISTEGLTYIDSNLTPGSKYFYRVVAYNTFGNSGPRFEKAVTLAELPEKPTDLELGLNSLRDQIVLTWADNSDDELVFELERSKGSDGEFELIIALDPNTLTYTDTDVVLEEQYQYRIRAVNISGGSDYSEAVTITIASANSMSAVESVISAYPNPSKGKLTINPGNLIVSNIEVYSFLGQLLRDIDGNNQLHVLDLSNFENGLYYVKVKTNGGEVTKKVYLVQ